MTVIDFYERARSDSNARKATTSILPLFVNVNFGQFVVCCLAGPFGGLEVWSLEVRRYGGMEVWKLGGLGVKLRLSPNLLRCAKSQILSAL
jgi:hypothetical protein